MFLAPPLALVPERQRHGKLIRGLLTFVGATAAGLEPGRVVPAAVAIELLHTASLVHDDLVDGSDTRRGLPSLHVRLGMPRALVIGDHLLMSAFRSITGLRGGFPPERVLLALDAFADAAERCALGELADVEGVADTGADKAGSLFAFAASAAAILAGAEGGLVAELTGYGRQVGVAYQARDDWLDGDGGTPATPSHQPRKGVGALRDLDGGAALQLEAIARFAAEHDA